MSMLQEQVATSCDRHESGAGNAVRGRLDVFIGREAVVGCVDEQCRDADVLEGELVRGGLGDERIECHPELLGSNREQCIADGEEVGVVARLPPLGDAP